MYTWGYAGPSNCLSCYGCMESCDHLFFHYGFSRRIWYTIMHDCGFSTPRFDWDLVVVWSVAKLKGKSLKVCLAKLCLKHLSSLEAKKLGLAIRVHGSGSGQPD
jgi:hypothetical protein